MSCVIRMRLEYIDVEMDVLRSWFQGSVLVIFCCVCGYVSLVGHDNYFARRCAAVSVVGVLFMESQRPASRLHRLYPVVCLIIGWLTVLYQLLLLFVLCQSVEEVRLWLKYFDDDLGQTIPEIDYGRNCTFFDTGNPNNPFHVVTDKIAQDVFIYTHLFGWWGKMFLFRDYWMAHFCSVLFEVLEYTLEHQIPNFSECWWDHWLLDVLICNGLGIWAGMLTLRFLKLERYDWTGIWNSSPASNIEENESPTSPTSWMGLDRRRFAMLKRFSVILLPIIALTLSDMNVFYLKLTLWLPTTHYLNMARLAFLAFTAAVTVPELYAAARDPLNCPLGRKSFFLCSIMATELLIVLKFAWKIVTMPFPRHVVIAWTVAIATAAFYKLCTANYFSEHERGKRKIGNGMVAENDLKTIIEEENVLDS